MHLRSIIQRPDQSEYTLDLIYTIFHFKSSSIRNLMCVILNLIILNFIENTLFSTFQTLSAYLVSTDYLEFESSPFSFYILQLNIQLKAWTIFFMFCTNVHEFQQIMSYLILFRVCHFDCYIDYVRIFLVISQIHPPVPASEHWRCGPK